MQKIVGIKRNGDKNMYYFSTNENYKIGDKVVVDFEEFQTIGTVAKLDLKIDSSKASELTKITRTATDADLKKYEELRKKSKQNMRVIKAKSLELGLMMKFVSAEYSMDNSKIIIVFTVK